MLFPPHFAGVPGISFRVPAAVRVLARQRGPQQPCPRAHHGGGGPAPAGLWAQPPLCPLQVKAMSFMGSGEMGLAAWGPGGRRPERARVPAALTETVSTCGRQAARWGAGGQHTGDAQRMEAIGQFVLLNYHLGVLGITRCCRGPPPPGPTH